jgi:hypothetical protein
MKKLEQYLDQVCRRISGPRALRQHVRQELREHLLDVPAILPSKSPVGWPASTRARPPIR